MLLRSPIAARMFETDEVLVLACNLVGHPGISVDSVSEPVTYVHLLFDWHEIVFTEGTATESLLTRREALKTWARTPLTKSPAFFRRWPTRVIRFRRSV
jgi:hypothetical protein